MAAPRDADTPYPDYPRGVKRVFSNRSGYEYVPRSVDSTPAVNRQRRAVAADANRRAKDYASRDVSPLMRAAARRLSKKQDS